MKTRKKDIRTVRKEMKAILNDIQTGKFVRDWMLECKVKQPNFKASRRISKDHQIEVVGKKLRDMISKAGQIAA